MTTSRLRRLRAAAPVLCLGLALTACGADGSAATAARSPFSQAAAGAGPAPAADRLPEDFPLAAGYPRDDQAEPVEGFGLEEPNRDSEPLVLHACGEQVPVPAHVDLLRAGWANVEDGRSRQLVRFAHDDAAQAYVDALDSLHRDCPRHLTSPEVEEWLVTDVRDGDLGDRSVSVVQRYEQGGHPAVGLTTVQVVRVGADVLVDLTYGEGGARGEADVVPAHRRSAEDVADVVAAMRDL